MTASFCPNCGAKTTAGSRFCPECGARLPEASVPPAASEPTAALTPPPSTPAIPPTVPLAADPATPAPAPRTRNARLIIGALIALGALLFGACIGLVLITVNFASTQRPASEVVLVETAVVPGATPAPAPILDGERLLDETFDDPASSVFGVEETDISRFAFEDGGYLVEVREPEYLVWWLADANFSDIVISADTVFPPATQVAAAALVFHYQDDDNFYLFSVSNDGYYTLEIKRDGAWDVLISWTESPEIDAVRNAIRVETRGERIALYVNDALLEETLDTTFSAGDIAVAVVSFDATPAIVRFDNLTIARSR
jgi:hypothetical protein